MDIGFKFYALLFIGAYLAVMVLTGIWYGRREDSGDFIIGNRNIGVIPTAASLAASFRDGGGIVFWISMGFAASYSALWLFVGVALSAAVLAYIGPKLRAEAAEDGHITIQERVREYVGPVSAKLTAVISLVFGILIMALQYHVSGSILAEIMGMPKVAGILATGLIIAAYMVAGGYKSVIVTDTIQFFIMFSLVVIPFLVHPAAADMMKFGTFFEGSFLDTTALLLFGLYYLIMVPESWQRIFSARNDTVIKKGLPLTAFVLLLMTLSLIWLGMGLRQVFPDIDKATLYATMFRDGTGISPWILGYVLLVFISITMSTQSAACYGFVSTFGKIFLPAKVQDGDTYIRFTRIGIVVALLLSGVMAMTVSRAVEYMFDIMGFVTCIAPLYIFAAIARTLSAYKGREGTLDKPLAITTALGVCVFFAFVVFKVTDGGFIYSVLPGVLTTIACAGVTFAKLRR